MLRRLGLLLAAITILGLGGHASAASPKTIDYKGISLSPAVVNLAVDQNLASTSFPITVTNNLDQKVELDISSLDFKSLNQTGGLAFISGTGKYGLASWLSLPQSPLSLAPNSSQTIKVVVDNRADLAPGGHYAAILFKNSRAGGGGQNKVSVNQVVATLVFLKKSGGEIYSLNMARPELGQSLLRLPRSINALISNTGNTQTIPRGTAVVTDPRGREIMRGQLNVDSGLVLPESSRLFRTQLNRVSHAWLPGWYSLTVSYEPADTNIANTETYRFFYLSLPSLICFLLVAVSIVFIMRSNYNNRPTPRLKK